MFKSMEPLQEFYTSEIGQIVRDILSAHIAEFWSDVHGLRVMGAGYAVPYLDQFMDKGAERVIAFCPSKNSCSKWPNDGVHKNLLALADDDMLPLETCSVDRILLVHHLENCEHMRQGLREVWRVLKPNGRLLVIVPNRVGVWARADWSPLGQGRPFSLTQISHFLREHMLQYEQSKSALFVPPLPDSPVMMKSAHFIEKWGQYLLPFVAGVHIVEASKQVYARAGDSGSGNAVVTKTKELLGVRGGVPVPQRLSPTKSPSIVLKGRSDRRRP